MEEYQERVVKEREELNEKLEKLNSFIEGKGFNDLKPEDRDLLQRQRAVMRRYVQILTKRINRFKA